MDKLIAFIKRNERPVLAAMHAFIFLGMVSFVFLCSFLGYHYSPAEHKIVGTSIGTFLGFVSYAVVMYP